MGYYIDLKHRWFWSLTKEGEPAVQSLDPLDRPEHDKPLEKIIDSNKKRRHVRSDVIWLEAAIETHLLNNRGFTIPSLYKYVESRMQESRIRTDSPPDFVDPDLLQDYKIPGKVFLPSEPILRRIVNKMAAEGKLEKTTWRLEVGRPTNIYYR